MAYTSIEVEVQDNAEVGEIVNVTVEIKNITSHIIYVTPVLYVNGDWTDEGDYRTIFPNFLSLFDPMPGAMFNLAFTMPDKNANVVVECWSENDEPWHLDSTAVKTVYVPGGSGTTFPMILIGGGLALAVFAYTRKK